MNFAHFYDHTFVSSYLIKYKKNSYLIKYKKNSDKKH